MRMEKSLWIFVQISDIIVHIVIICITQFIDNMLVYITQSSHILFWNTEKIAIEIYNNYISYKFNDDRIHVMFNNSVARPSAIRNYTKYWYNTKSINKTDWYLHILHKLQLLDTLDHSYSNLEPFIALPPKSTILSWPKLIYKVNNHSNCNYQSWF